MAANITLDTVLGSVPVIGDVFDAVWKANRKNLALLERHVAEPTPAKRADRLFVIVVCGTLVVLSVALLVGTALLAAAVLKILLAGPLP